MPLHVGIISRKIHTYRAAINVATGNDVTERQRNWS